MFNFVVRRLKWLARVPLFPHFFDAALVVGVIIGDRPKLRAMEEFKNMVTQRQGIRLAPHRFGGVGFFLGEVEIGHLHGNGLIDLVVGRETRDRLVATGRAQPHHVFPRTGWISFSLRQPGDVPTAVELFDIGVAQRRRLLAAPSA